MPKRSNDFQKLVLHLKKHRLPNTYIKESAELLDPILKEKREVDICIKTNLQEHTITISIECTNKIRPVDIGWVEQMKCKHDRLETNLLVLVSKNGFTQQAEEYAKIYSIETYQFTEIAGETPSEFIKDLKELTFKMTNLKVEKVLVYVLSDNDEVIKVRVSPDNIVFNEGGEQLGNVLKLVNFLINQPAAIKKILSKGNESHKCFVIDWYPPEQERMFLHNIKTDNLEQVNRIQIIGDPQLKVRKVKTTIGQLGEDRIVWGKTEIDESNFYFIGTINDSQFSLFTDD